MNPPDDEYYAERWRMYHKQITPPATSPISRSSKGAGRLNGRATKSRSGSLLGPAEADARMSDSCSDFRTPSTAQREVSAEAMDMDMDTAGFEMMGPESDDADDSRRSDSYNDQLSAGSQLHSFRGVSPAQVPTFGSTSTLTTNEPFGKYTQTSVTFGSVALGAPLAEPFLRVEETQQERPETPDEAQQRVDEKRNCAVTEYLSNIIKTDEKGKWEKYEAYNKRTGMSVRKQIKLYKWVREQIKKYKGSLTPESLKNASSEVITEVCTCVLCCFLSPCFPAMSEYRC